MGLYLFQDLLGIVLVLPEIRIKSDLFFFCELELTLIYVKDTSLSGPNGFAALSAVQLSW